MRKLACAIVAILLLTCSMASAQGSRRVLSFGGKTLWTPLNLGASLVAWWDAQYTPNLTFNGSNISAWTDRKSGIVASQATGANQPGWSAISRNGKAGLTFNGTSQFLTFTPAGFPTGSATGSIAVAAFSSLTNPGAQTIAFTYGANATTGGESIISEQNTNGAVALSTSGGTPVGATSSWNTTDRFQILSASGTTGTQNVDGNTAETGLVTSTNLIAAIGSIGEWTLFGNKWTGAIQQIIVTSAVISTCQRQKLEGWESWYDGKAGANLPASHPYRNATPTIGGAC